MSIRADRLHIDPLVGLYAAMMLLLIPLRWIFAMILSASIHELGHLLCVRLCGGCIRNVDIGLRGLRIRSDPLPHRQALICIAGGPAANLLMVFYRRLFPRIAICAFFQMVYNLLPFYPLDGGRMLRLILGRDREERIESGFLILLCTGVAVLAYVFRNAQLLFLLFPVSEFAVRKIPCKQRQQIVQ